MASQRKRQSPEPTKPGYSDDPFCHGDAEPPREEPEVAGYIITGLSDEADAKRYLALQFDETLNFCPNCEIVMPEPGSLTCLTCGDLLGPVGTKPRQKKYSRLHHYKPEPPRKWRNWSR